MARSPLTRRRLLGLDRSGAPPPETRSSEPLRPLTAPNLVGFARLALVPVFLVIALGSGDGRSAPAMVIYASIAAGDYVDGLLARLTGQYSRLGALLDPLCDRLLVIAGVAVAWEFELLPRWALAALAAREALMLALSEVGLRLGLELRISMLGRIAVWPTMSAFGLAMITETWLSRALLYGGLVLSLATSARYVHDAWGALRARAERPAPARDGPSSCG